MNTNLDIIYFHMAFINPNSKYHWICSECIKTHGKNCSAVIQSNNKKDMKKLIKVHCNDEDHVLAVENNIIDADPEYIKYKEEYLRDNKEKLEEIVSQF